MKWTKLSALLMELFRLRDFIDNNNAPTVATITPASATEGSDVVTLRSNPSAVDTSYFCSNKWYGGSADYTTTDVSSSCWSILERYRYQHADTIDEVDFQHC
jgi:hypothetical protein